MAGPRKVDGKGVVSPQFHDSYCKSIAAQNAEVSWSFVAREREDEEELEDEDEEKRKKNRERERKEGKRMFNNDEDEEKDAKRTGRTTEK